MKKMAWGLLLLMMSRKYLSFITLNLKLDFIFKSQLFPFNPVLV